MRILLLAILLASLAAWCGETGSVRVYDELEIYEALKPSDVAMAPDGSVYILDNRSRKVLHFDARGRRMADFSRKGQGPGEMEWPDGIFFHQGKVVVHDGNKVALFSPEGVFLKEYSSKFLASGLLVPVKDGWLSSTRNVTIQWEEPGRLLLLTEKGLEDKVLMEWKRSKKVNQPMMIKRGNTIRMAFNPTMERDFIVYARDGEKAWFRSTASRDIYLVDVVAKKVEKFITMPEGPLFNSFWADEKLDAFIKNRKPSPLKFEAEKNYPERFPAIRKMSLCYDGLLHVEMWSRAPEKEYPQMVFNMEGGVEKSDILPKHLSQILAYASNMACVGLMDEEEEVASLAVVPIQEVTSFINEHSIKKVFSAFD